MDPQMIDIELAYQLLMESSHQMLSAETVRIEEGLGRVLSQDIISDIDMPSFNRVMMDGYACRREDLMVELKLLETITAGQLPQKEITKGECSKVMTGAVLPVGANCVFMVEDAQQLPGGLLKFAGAKTKDNVSPQGEFVRAHEVVLNKGTSIAPQHMAILASVGQTSFAVYRKIKVGIITTGDELINPSLFPGPTQLRNSNGLQLYGQIIKASGIPYDYGIVADQEKMIEERIEQALSSNDMVLLTGGVSMGDLDLVKVVMQKKCEKIFFESLAIKPGKPTVAGMYRGKFCFGLPGNPVSSFVVFKLLVEPLMRKLMGASEMDPPFKLRLPLMTEIKIKNPDRQSWLPVKLESAGARPLNYQGSAHSHSLAQANGLISVDKGITNLKAGSMIDVRFI